MADRRFAAAVAAIVVLGFGARLWFALALAPDLPTPGDAVLYRELAANLADGRGLSLPGLVDPGLVPSAEHPPAFPVVLASLDVVGLDGMASQRVSLAAISAAGVVLVALVGRRVGGAAAGLGAGAVAALHPLWMQAAGMVMSESLHLVLVPGALLAALRVVERPSIPRVALLGAVIGAAEPWWCCG